MVNLDKKYTTIKALDKIISVSSNDEFKKNVDKVLNELISSPDYMLRHRVDRVINLTVQYYPNSMKSDESKEIYGLVSKVDCLWREDEE